MFVQFLWSGWFLGQAETATANIYKLLIRKLLVHDFSMSLLEQLIL